MASGLLALGAVLIGAQPAAASCAPQTLADETARADVVAFGTVTSVRMTFAAAGGVVTFRPERVLKGTLTRSVQVYLGPTHGGAVTSVDYQAAAPQPHTHNASSATRPMMMLRPLNSPPPDGFDSGGTLRLGGAFGVGGRLPGSFPGRLLGPGTLGGFMASSWDRCASGCRYG